MDLVSFLASFEFDAVLKILLGGVLAGIIGLERSSLNKPAGFGTYSILGISAVLVVVASEYLSLSYDIDVARIPAQMIAGIGFIGAGTILHSGMNVRGVTTATGLLAVTCIGIAVGCGFYLAGIIATVIVFLLLRYSHNISDTFSKYDSICINIEVSSNLKECIKEIEKYFNDTNINIESIRSENNIIEVLCNYDNKKINSNEILGNIINIKNVLGVTID